MKKAASLKRISLHDKKGLEIMTEEDITIKPPESERKPVTFKVVNRRKGKISRWEK